MVDALGRSLSLVSAPNPAHQEWLHAEARALAHRNHPSIPTTYHYWAAAPRESRRGPGYLRRWIAGETLAARVRRLGADDLPAALRLLREAGSAVGYLHDSGGTLSRAIAHCQPRIQMRPEGVSQVVRPASAPCVPPLSCR